MRIESIPPGTVFWDFSKIKKKMFIQFQDQSQVLSFDTIIFGGSGKLPAQKFVTKVLNNQCIVREKITNTISETHFNFNFK